MKPSSTRLPLQLVVALLVPVVGTLSLVREAGEPKHFLLDVTGSQLPA